MNLKQFPRHIFARYSFTLRHNRIVTRRSLRTQGSDEHLDAAIGSATKNQEK